MKKLIIGFTFCFLTLYANSQDTSKISRIKTLLELSGSGKIGVQVFQNMLTSFKKNLPKVPQEFWDDFSKEVKPDILTEMIVPIYDKYYTTDEINQLIEFYQTPIGKKMISTLPQIMQESMEAGQVWGKAIAEKVLKNLTEKGFLDDTK